MTVPLVVFFALAGLAVIGAVSLILQKHPIHSALSLIVVMVALAGLYLLLGAEFVAAVQIIVYGGAIMVLFVFVIMLLNAGVEEHTNFEAGGPAGAAAGCGAGGIHYRDPCENDSGRARVVADRGDGFDERHFEHVVPGFCVSVRTDVVSDSRGGDGRDGAGAAGETLKWCRRTTTSF